MLEWKIQNPAQLKESIILLTIGIRDPGSTNNNAGIQNPKSKTFLEYLTRGEIII